MLVKSEARDDIKKEEVGSRDTHVIDPLIAALIKTKYKEVLRTNKRR